jgi:hypothetical protein
VTAHDVVGEIEAVDVEHAVVVGREPHAAVGTEPRIELVGAAVGEPGPGLRRDVEQPQILVVVAV